MNHLETDDLAHYTQAQLQQLKAHLEVEKIKAEIFKIDTERKCLPWQVAARALWAAAVVLALSALILFLTRP